MKKLSNTEAELKKIIMLCHACLKQKLHNKDNITKLPYHMLGKHLKISLHVLYKVSVLIKIKNAEGKCTFRTKIISQKLLL